MGFFDGFEKRAAMSPIAKKLLWAGAGLGLSAGIGGALGVKNPETGKREKRKERALHEVGAVAGAATGGYLTERLMGDKLRRAPQVLRRASKTNFVKRAPRTVSRIIGKSLLGSLLPLGGIIAGDIVANKALKKWGPLAEKNDGHTKSAAFRETTPCPSCGAPAVEMTSVRTNRTVAATGSTAKGRDAEYYPRELSEAIVYRCTRCGKSTSEWR